MNLFWFALFVSARKKRIRVPEFSVSAGFITALSTKNRLSFLN